MPASNRRDDAAHAIASAIVSSSSTMQILSDKATDTDPLPKKIAEMAYEIADAMEVLA